MKRSNLTDRPSHAASSIVQTHVVHSDQPVRLTVEPMSSAQDATWFRLFRSIIHSGAWARLTPAASKVLVVLAECVNDQMRKESGRWIAWPSIATIASRAGIERRAAQKAVAALEAERLVQRCRRRNGTRGDYSNEYELTPPASSESAVTEPPTPAHQKTHPGAHERAPGGAIARAHAPRSDMRPARAPASAQQRKNKKEIDLNNSSPSTETVSRAGQLLIDAGVREPALGKLLAGFDEKELLLRISDWEMRKQSGMQLGVAWLIASIQQQYELHESTRSRIDRQSKQDAARAHRLKQLEADAAEEQRQRDVEAQTLALLESMSDQERAHWKRVVVEEFPSMIRNPDSADPMTHPRLKRLILGKLAHVVG
jgi:DNA-binding MarR family transcriptional regulator